MKKRGYLRIGGLITTLVMVLGLATGPALASPPEKGEGNVAVSPMGLISSFLTGFCLPSGEKEGYDFNANYKFNVESDSGLTPEVVKPKRNEGTEENSTVELHLAKGKLLKLCTGDDTIDLGLQKKYGANAGVEAELVKEEAPSTLPQKPSTEVKPAPGPSLPSVQPMSIVIEPTEDINCIKTQYVITATVTGCCGTPAPGQMVEWILNQSPEAVGDILQVGPQGQISGNHAVSITDSEGKAYLIITSTRPGDTDITAFCPGIKDASKHKAFAVKHWVEEDPSTELALTSASPVTSSVGRARGK